jgi:hypothetical protein
LGKNACMAPDDPKPDVMSSLPRTRPQRRSAKRDAPVKTAPPRKAAPKKAAPRAKAAPPKKATPRAKAAPANIPPAGFAPPRDTEARPVPTGVELVGTAIQAAGELAQIGIAVGGQALKSALGRLGRS